VRAGIADDRSALSDQDRQSAAMLGEAMCEVITAELAALFGREGPPICIL
jgi:hypothetical protein